MQYINKDEALLLVKGADPQLFFEKAPKSYKGAPTYICPGCGNGSGADGTGFHHDPAREGKYHCFKCDADGDLLDFIGMQTGLIGADLFQYAYEQLGIQTTGGVQQVRIRERELPQEKPKEEKRDEVQKDLGLISQFIENREEALSYLEGRGISRETAARFFIGYNPDQYFSQDKKTSGALIIPTSSTSYVARNLDPEGQRWSAKGGRMPFNLLNLKNIPPTDNVYIVEGEIDALSILELGFHAIGLGGANQVLYEELKKTKYGHNFIVAMDNDEAGRNKNRKISEELKTLGIPHQVVNLSGDYKDPNELLTEDRAELQRILSLGEKLEQIQKAEEHEKTSAGARVDEFLEAVSQGHYIPICRTGYPTLDAAIGGGLYWGLYVLGAISSLGKTTYLLQLMDQIAAQGSDALIFSLEMSRHELIAKSISRESFKYTKAKSMDRSHAKTTRDVMDKRRQDSFTEKDKDVFSEAVRAYIKYAGKLYIHEGEGSITAAQIREKIEEHIKITGNRPVVLIDYLQLITPENDRWSERQNMDHAVSNLRITARDLRVPIIAVSSLNRGSYGNQEASISGFKESGGIEYGADTAMIMQFSKKLDTGNKEPKKGELDRWERQQKQKTPREVEVVIVKNRNGRTGDTMYYLYYPEYNHFAEDHSGLFDNIQKLRSI